MSTLAVIAMALAGVWLGALTLAVLAMVRQVALVTLRLDRADEARDLDGLSIGSAVPDEVASVLPAGAHARTFLLMLEADCGPCRDLADGLHDQRFDERIVAIVAGDETRAASIASRLPETFAAVMGAPAAAAVKALDVATSPFLFLVENGEIAGKNGPRNAAHFRALVTGEQVSHHDQQAPHEQNGRPLLEVSHVD